MTALEITYKKKNHVSNQSFLLNMSLIKENKEKKEIKRHCLFTINQNQISANHLYKRPISIDAFLYQLVVS